MRHFILRADVMIKNVGLYMLKIGLAVCCRLVYGTLATYCRLAADKSVASPANPCDVV
jgi:hypothetical protein